MPFRRGIRALLGKLAPSQVLHGVVASYLNTGMTILANFVGIPLFIRLLGRDDYGIWLATSGMTAYLGLLNLGITQTTATRFGMALAERSPDLATRVLATGFWAFAKVAWPLALLTALTGLWIPIENAFRGVGDPGHARMVVTVAATALLIELPFGIFQLCLRAAGSVAAQQRIAAGQTIGKLVLPVTALAMGAGLPVVVALQSIVNVSAHILAFTRLRRHTDGFSLARWRADPHLAYEMRSPSRYFLLMQISSAIAFGSDHLVISAMLGPASLAPYGIAQRLVSTAAGLSITVSGNYGPAFLSAYGKRDLSRLRRLYKNAMLLSLGAAAAIAVLVLVVGPSFIRLWVGSANYVGFWPLVTLVGLAVMQMLLSPADALLTMTANHRLYSVVAVWEALLSTVLSVLFCNWLGIAGVALGSILGRLFGCGPVMVGSTIRLLSASTGRGSRGAGVPGTGEAV